MTTEKKFPKKLFQNWKNGVYAGLALSGSIISEGGQDSKQETLAFFDTNRGRIFQGKLLKESNVGYSFLTENGDTLEFKEATLASYDKYSRPEVEGTVPVFRYEQDLHEWYRRRFLQQ